ncbi:1-acyl-sn-glycerol-3-phosphate acyltransferase [bacterium]|nr:1-acyl-sn-glycerol-3-phosphate acyltransferase [bacterium]
MKLVFYTSLALLALFIQQKRFGKNLAVANNVAQHWAKTMLKTYGIRIHIKGQIPEGNNIIVANHRSYMDIPVLLSFVPATFLSKQEIASWPLIGWGARMAGCIFLNRHSKPSRKNALAQIDALQKEDIPVILFPEGTTCQAPHFEDFRPGSFYLAAKKNYTIVPVAIEYANTEDAWIEDASFLTHFIKQMSNPTRDIYISFGKPLTGKDGGVLKNQAQHFITREALAIFKKNQQQGSIYDKTVLPYLIPIPSGT